MSTADEIRARIARRDRFSYAEIAGFIADESDLDVWSAVYLALGESFRRIKPEPGMEMTCSFIMRYLLRCIREDPSHEHVPFGHEAATDLAECLKLWASKLPETEPVLEWAARDIAQELTGGDARVRDTILNGMLEHALESARVRPFFEHWRNDPILGDAWRLAMEWAVAHGDPAGPPMSDQRDK